MFSVLVFLRSAVHPLKQAAGYAASFIRQSQPTASFSAVKGFDALSCYCERYLENAADSEFAQQPSIGLQKL